VNTGLVCCPSCLGCAILRFIRIYDCENKWSDSMRVLPYSNTLVLSCPNTNSLPSSILAVVDAPWSTRRAARYVCHVLLVRRGCCQLVALPLTRWSGGNPGRLSRVTAQRWTASNSMRAARICGAQRRKSVQTPPAVALSTRPLQRRWRRRRRGCSARGGRARQSRSRVPCFPRCEEAQRPPGRRTCAEAPCAVRGGAAKQRRSCACEHSVIGLLQLQCVHRRHVLTCKRSCRGRTFAFQACARSLVPGADECAVQATARAPQA